MMSEFVDLDDLTLPIGKKTRLYRLLYLNGPGNGTAMFLPIDQGLEHGPMDFFSNPDSKNPDYQLELALRGNYTGIVFQIGLAEKYMHRFAGRVPLVLKLNGKTAIPSDDEAFSPLIGSVEDAVRLGADAVGYTLYVGSPAQAEDFLQFEKVREDAEAYGMPVIVWAYPRGSAVEAKGGLFTFEVYCSYNAVKCYIDAVERAKSADKAAVIAALETSTWSDHFMPYGPTKFVNGQNQGGRAVLLQASKTDIEVVWPNEFASTKAVFPRPKFS
jgi:hypothetical protein